MRPTGDLEGRSYPRARALTSLAFLAAFGIYACASMSESADKAGGDNGGDAGAPGANGAGPDLPTDNGVILVHASRATSFRLCFSNFAKQVPSPDTATMPEANIIGVDVGSAVRIPPLSGPPGDVFLFGDLVIRQQYPPGQKGPTCEQLLTDNGTKDSAVKIGTVTASLGRGVHLLVVTGCPAKNLLQSFTVAECGPGYDETKGNLAIKQLELRGASRQSSDELPTQVLHLSQPLETARGPKALDVSFGEVPIGDGGVDAGPLDGGSGASSVVGPVLFGPPKEFMPAPRYASGDAGSYAGQGFRVRLGTDPSFVLAQSLADVQALSSPRDVPNTYFAAASNYVLLLLGDPDPRINGDGGPDPDERRRLHFLAVPVVEARDGGTPDAASSDDDGG